MIPTRRDAYQLLHNGILAFQRAEQYGMRIDVKYCESKKIELTEQINKIEKEFKKSKFYKHWEHATKGTININSNPQLAAFLYKIKRIEPKKLTTTGKGATDEDALMQLKIPEVSMILQMRKLRKLRDTYLDAYIREQINGVIHPFFNLHNVVSYRSSSDSPNFQNIPKRDEESMRIVRRGIVPRPGHQLLEADWSGAEVKTSVCVHKDPVMYKYVTDETTDMHRDVGMQLFLFDDFNKKTEGHNLIRQATKNGFVFPQFYGDWYKSCAEYMAHDWCKLPEGRWKPGQGIKFDDTYISNHLITKGINSLDAFINHVQTIEDDFWKRRFKVYNQWRNDFFAAYQRKGYFDLVTGFRCSGLFNKKQVCNYPIQGPSFHTLLWCFIELDRISQEEEWESRLLGQVHDSMVWDIEPSELQHVIQTIEYVATVLLPKAMRWITVPFKLEFELCDVDQPWSEKHEYKLAA